MGKGVTSGVFQVGIMVSDIDECLRLFCDTLGMKVVFEARNQIQPASGLSGTDHQLMHCLYVDPPAKPCPPMNHNDLGSMHFMLRADDIYAVVEKVQKLGYELMNPVVESKTLKGFKFTYFRGPDGVMVELHEGGEVRMPANMENA